MIRLFFNQEIFFAQKYGGISRYQAELIKGLPKYSDIKVETCIWYNLNYHYYRKRIQWFDRIVSKLNDWALGRLLDPIHILNQKMVERKLRNGHFDYYIPSYYNTKFLNHIGNKPYVLTVYDMIHELFPHYFPRDHTTVPNKKTLLLKAKRIIAISHSTKADILKFYPEINPDIIDVVHLSHSIKPEESIPLEGLPNKYILFVGSRKNYKNFGFFLDALKPIIQQDLNLHLVCTGDPFTVAEKDKFKEYQILDRVHYIKVDDKQLYPLYHQSQAFVFPSEYEGFGIPVVEAMVSGTPVILSRSSSFPEVAGDAGLYFELGDSKTLTQHIKKILTDQQFREHMIELGLKQSKKFSWENTVHDFYQTIQTVSKL